MTPHWNKSEATRDWDQKESGYKERKTKENQKKRGKERNDRSKQKMKENKKLFKYQYSMNNKYTNIIIFNYKLLYISKNSCAL